MAGISCNWYPSIGGSGGDFIPLRRGILLLPLLFHELRFCGLGEEPSFPSRRLRQQLLSAPCKPVERLVKVYNDTDCSYQRGLLLNNYPAVCI